MSHRRITRAAREHLLALLTPPLVAVPGDLPTHPGPHKAAPKSFKSGWRIPSRAAESTPVVLADRPAKPPAKVKR